MRFWQMTLLPILWMSTAHGQQKALNQVVHTVTKDVKSIKDPIETAAIYIGFSHCEFVKRILGVDYDQYKKDPDMSKLSLDFISHEVSIQFNLPDLSIMAWSKWFKPQNGIIIYIHGFTDNPYDGSFRNVSQAFLLQGITSIVALDASSLISWFYLRSSTMVRFIGEQLGEGLTEMIKAGLDPASIYLIGHSLGAHIASFAGKTALANTGYRVGRISGLDPAGPCFSNVDASLRLNKDDALYVDVIHTDAGVYGLDKVVGHADFYPNGGSEQPGCFLQTCSHSRAWHLFAESVLNPTGFPAVTCTSWKAFEDGLLQNCTYTDYSYMGFGSSPYTRGQYYLHTADSYPYALGVNGMVYTD